MPAPIDTLVTVYGGSGFLGRHVVRALARRGYRIRVGVRRPDLAGHLQPLGRVGQIHAVQANLRYPDSVTAAARDASASASCSVANVPMASRRVSKSYSEAGFSSATALKCAAGTPLSA